MRTIDLNADVGEGSPHDAELIPLVTSANIACGGHAGDEDSMYDAVMFAISSGTKIGAHPGHTDRQHFGRREQNISPSELRQLLNNQIESLELQAWDIQGEPIRYLKLHGALYHQAGRDRELARAVVEIVKRYWAKPFAVVGQTGSILEQEAELAGIRFIREAFPDRRYLKDGSLSPRSEPDSVLSNPHEIADQAVRLAQDHDSLCLHGDEPRAIENAIAMREALLSQGFQIRSFAN